MGISPPYIMGEVTPDFRHLRSPCSDFPEAYRAKAGASDMRRGPNEPIAGQDQGCQSQNLTYSCSDSETWSVDRLSLDCDGEGRSIPVSHLAPLFTFWSPGTHVLHTARHHHPSTSDLATCLATNQRKTDARRRASAYPRALPIHAHKNESSRWIV